MSTTDQTDLRTSMCCSETTCQQSVNGQFTCGGNEPSDFIIFLNSFLVYVLIIVIVIQNFGITYPLPVEIRPLIGPLNPELIDIVERRVNEMLIG